MWQLQPAARENVKLMVGITGPSGSGKTLSALKLARGIAGSWDAVALADTENRSSLHYAGDMTGSWKFIEFPCDISGGYSPKNYCDLIEHVEKNHPEIKVLVIDSISHEWEGEGGCLELVDKIGKGGSGWRKVTPLHQGFIDTMRHSRMDIVATMRSKQDYVFEQNEKGRTTPKKVGMRAVQREGIEYEFGLVFDVEINHLATASKDRTNMFINQEPFQIDISTGEQLKTWANSGVSKLLVLYNETPEQKIRFAQHCAKWKITDRKRMGELSAAFRGREFDDETLDGFFKQVVQAEAIMNDQPIPSEVEGEVEVKPEEVFNNAG